MLDFLLFLYIFLGQLNNLVKKLPPSGPSSSVFSVPKNQNQNLNVLEEKKATATEIDILRNHVRQCWNAPYAANELNKIINLKIFTNPDGSVVNVQIIDVAFYKKDPVYRAAADSARRAVKDCSPLPLPKNKYDLFKIFTFNFDTSFING